MMKNNVNKKGSNFKKLIPAAGMLAVSATMLATSTYAWFSMNTQVTATGMQVKAAAEGGIVISNSAKSSWTAQANAQVTTATLFPTSHAKAASGSWYHNTSDNANDAKAGQLATSYETLSTVYSSTADGGEGVAYVDVNSNNTYDTGTDSAYYLLNNFYIKSSGDTLSTPLLLNQVTVSSSNTLLDIDAALRVLVVVDGTAFLYAPVSTGTASPTLTYKVAGSSSDTEAGAATVKNVATGVTSIPNTDEGAIPVKVYVYFEGEDANCKSTNISGITTDSLTVSVQFGTTSIS
jgi:hypothetical protein